MYVLYFIYHLNANNIKTVIIISYYIGQYVYIHGQKGTFMGKATYKSYRLEYV